MMTARGGWRSGRARRPGTGAAAYTLPSLMVGMAIFMMVIGAIVAINLMGMRLFEFSKAKIDAGEKTRLLLGELNGRIREADLLLLGTYTNQAFEAVGDNTPQQGSALFLLDQRNRTNRYEIYYVDASDKLFKRIRYHEKTPAVLADNLVSNSVVFSCQNFSGTILNNPSSGGLLSVDLVFYEVAAASLKYGSENQGTYRVSTKVSQRVRE